ncbi:hypothetical protein Tco_1110095, partial [Tanacetum coccineum]
MQTFLADKANLSIAPQKGKKTKPHVIPYCRFTKLIICHLGRTHNIHQRSVSPLHLAEEDHRHGNLKFFPKGEEDEVFGMQIPKDLITNTIRNAPYYNAYMEMVAKHDKKIIAEKGGKKKSASKADQSKKPTTYKQPKLVPSKQSKPAPAMKSKVTQEKPSKPSHVKHPKRGKVQKVRKGKSSLKLIDEDEEVHHEPEPQGVGEDYDLNRPIQISLETFQAYGQAPIGGVAICEQVEEDDASANIVRDSLSSADAETGADTDITTSTVNIEVLYAEDVQGEEISHTVVLEEKIAELDEGQAGSDPGKTPESRPPPEHEDMDEDQAGPNPRQSHEALVGPHPEPMHDDFIATVYPKVHEILKHTMKEHVYLENPLSSSGTLSSMKNLDDAFTFDDQFLNDKPTEEEPGKTTMETKVESMVIVPIHQASTLVTPLSTTIIDLSPPKPTTQALSSRIFTLELRDLPYKINQTVNEVVKEVVHIALQAPLRDRFRELPEADMKEILHQRMFESSSYKSLPEHVALYEGLEVSMKCANRDEFLAEKDKSRKRRLKDVSVPDDVNISDSEDTNTAHLPKIKTRLDWLNPVPEEDRPETPEPDWIIPPNDLPETENNWANFCKRIEKKKLSKADLEGPSFKSKPLPLRGPPGQVTIQPQFFFNKDLEYLVSGSKERRSALSISKLKAANYPNFGLKELVPSLWIKSEREYDISVAHGISRWWFKRKEFYLNGHSAPSDRHVVRSHMRILSVVNLKT